MSRLLNLIWFVVHQRNIRSYQLLHHSHYSTNLGIHSAVNMMCFECNIIDIVNLGKSFCSFYNLIFILFKYMYSGFHPVNIPNNRYKIFKIQPSTKVFMYRLKLCSKKIFFKQFSIFFFGFFIIPRILEFMFGYFGIGRNDKLFSWKSGAYGCFTPFFMQILDA